MAPIAASYTSVIEVVSDWHDRIVTQETLRAQIAAAQAQIEQLQAQVQSLQTQADVAAADEAALAIIMRQFATSESWQTFVAAAQAAGKV